MKKILSILLVFAMLTGIAVAQDAPVVEGEASVTWGIDFGAGNDKDAADRHAYASHGFYNDSWVDFYFPLVSDSSVGGTEKADVYVDFKIYNEYKPHDIRKTAYTEIQVAKLVFYGAYIDVLQPGFSANKAQGWKPINKFRRGPSTAWHTPAFDGYGLTIGYANPEIMGLDVGLKFASNANWELKRADEGKFKKAEHKDSKYAFGLDFAMEPVEKYLSIEATMNSTFDRPSIYTSGTEPSRIGGEKGENVLFNMGLKLASEPIDSLKIALGFDGVTGLRYENKERETRATLGWDMGLTVGYKWIDFGLYVAGAGTEKDGYDYSDLKNGKFTDDTTDMAMHLGFKSDESGDTNFVDGLAFHVTLNSYNLLSKRAKFEGNDTAKKVAMALLATNGASDPAVIAAQAAYDAALAGYLTADPTHTEDGFKDSGDPTIAALQTAKENAEVKAKGFMKTDLFTVPLALNVGVSYRAKINDSMWIKPFANFWGETNHSAQHADVTKKPEDFISKAYFGMAYNIGVDFSPVEKVVITAKWAQGKLNKNTYEGGFGGQYMIETPMNYKMHNGTLTLGMTLQF